MTSDKSASKAITLTAKELGEKQFVANRPLTVEREAVVIVFDQKSRQFVYKTVKTTMQAEYEYDATRGRVVYIPSFKEKASNRDK